MRVVIFGATGMVGQGVLHACVHDADIEEILVVGRTPVAVGHPKVRELIHRDFADFGPIQDQFENLDACFYCLGVSSAGQTEQDYTRITYDFTIAAARALSAGNPELTFVYVSGQGTDSTEKGRFMWARVKGRTENALLGMPFHAVMFRPGYIQPRHGATSKTAAYRLIYRMISWLYPVLRRVAPRYVTTTDNLGRAMIAVAGRQGTEPSVLDNTSINRLGEA